MTLSKKNETILLIVWTVTLLATAGSLYYSEVRGYIPCELCWIQRILMYPLVIVYGVSLWKKNMDIALPGVILSGIGLLVSVYHYSLQKIPALQDTGGICGDVPCTLQYVNYLGFITIPFQSMIAFIIIFVLHIYVLGKNAKAK